MAEFPIYITSMGGAKAEAEIKAILTGAKATSAEIAGLSRTLNTSAKSAAAFATSIGLSAGQTQVIIAKFRALKESGLSNAQAFRVLQKETGITATQYRKLSQGLADADKQLEDYVATQKAASAAQRDAAEVSIVQLQALQEVNMQAQQVAGALRGFVGQVVSEFISYDDALTSVSAKTGLARDQLGFLAEAAQEVALATTQSPTGAVKAADSLIALGASAEQAADRLGTVAKLTDALRSVGADIETSAKVIQLGIQVYGEWGETAETVGDKIAYISDTSAVASSTGLQEFLQLFSKAAPVTKKLGVGLDELLASFAILRNAGQAPEVAATSLKSLTQTLLDKREELDAMGIKIRDVNNEFRGLGAIFADIGTANLGEILGLSDEAVQEAIKATPRDIQEMAKALDGASLSAEEANDIFGKIGLASALTLSDSFAEVAEKTLELGGNADVASEAIGSLDRKSAALNSSIQGQIKLLEGSVQTAFVKLGEVIGKFTGPFVGASIALVNAFISADPVLQKFIGGIIGISAALATLVASVTGYALALKALEAAQVGATAKAALAAFAETANATAKKINAAATAQLTVSEIALASSRGVATAATTAYTAATSAATKATIATALPIAALAAALVGVAATAKFFIDTLNAVDGAAATNRDALNDVRDAAGEAKVEVGGLAGAINNLREIWKSYVQEASDNRASVAFADLTVEVGKTEQAFYSLAARGFTPGSEAATKLAERIQANIKALEESKPVNEDDIAIRDAQIRRLQLQADKLLGVETAQEDATAATEDATQAQEQQNKATKTAVDLQGELNQRLADSAIAATEAQTQAYLQFGADKEGLDRRLSEIEKEELNRRLNEQLRYLADLKTATFESEDERKKAITEGEKELADIKLEQAKAVADEQAEAAQKAAQEQEKAAQDAEAKKEKAARDAAEEQERLAREAAAEQERIERERIRTEQALREAAFNEQMRQIDEQQRAYELSAIAQTQAQEDILEGLSDQNDALNQQIALLSLAQERSELITSQRIAGIDQEIEGLQSAEALLKIINDTEASREEKELARKRLREIGISDKLTELQLTQKFLDLEEERRKAEFEALLKKQEADRQILALQQEQERIGLRRQAAEAEINRIKSDQLVIESQLAQLRAQTELANAQANLARLQQEGAPEADLIAAQQDIAAKEQALRLTGDQVALAQESATVAAEASQDAADALVEYEQIAAAQTQNLTLAQQITLEQEKAADAAERFAAALERAAATNSETKDQLVGTVTPEARRLGGPVSPQGLYRVNEAGVEAFKPLAGGPPVPLSNIPSNGLFKPSVPGRIIPAGLAGAVSGGAGAGAVIKELRALRQEIASRPVSVDMPATFYNEPSPLVTRIQLAQNQIKLSRGV